MFSVSGHEYTIRADGRGERSLENARAKNFTLKLEQGHIEQVFFLEYEGDLLLIYQLSGKQEVNGSIVRMNQTTLKPVWSKSVTGFGLDGAVVDGPYLKIKNSREELKLDLRSGVVAPD